MDSIETLQVVRYDVGQQYKIHRDYIIPEILVHDYWGQFGQRYASFFVYLQEPESGGNTTFHDLNISFPPRKNDASKCVWLRVEI